MTQRMVTTLEQSKLLKEWKAPQNTHVSWLYCWWSDEGILVETEEVLDHPLSHETTESPYIAYPYAAYTLQELIEWLGENFDTLSRQHDNSWASALPFIGCVYGVSPLEAVFELCKAIKAKK